MLIAHLSDPHLREKGHLYQGLVDSNAMFDLAVETLNALRPEPDLVIIGGDLVDEATEAEYETVRHALARLRQPVYAIPGNHDEREAFRACFRETGYPTAAGPLHFDTGARWRVRVIGFDVTVPGQHHGDIDDAAFLWLEQALTRCPDQPTVILMHQPPIESGIHFIDAYKCLRGERLAELLLRHGNIERVLCGHVHRFMQAQFAGTTLMTAPSTATSIALRLAEDSVPASYVEPPAFLLHHWRPGHGLVTHWVPIGNFPGPMPFF
ncbi:phosphodiesterase [Labrys okinawensis]|uniref:Phosphodiesterase n=1 Tax=Labrys okinawensis TaxID=346911 RepID=A0A2S9QIP4_9HYPH|nr:phosphodiesterase [Labrys okinawensis]PRH89205.1 phosphodiesterase [Labrys okinawensis]